MCSINTSQSADEPAFTGPLGWQDFVVAPSVAPFSTMPLIRVR